MIFLMDTGMNTDKVQHKSASFIIRRTCTTKKSYTFKDADDFITEKMEQGIVLYYYKCIFCGRYHISKQDHTVNVLEIIGG